MVTNKRRKKKEKRGRETAEPNLNSCYRIVIFKRGNHELVVAVVVVPW